MRLRGGREDIRGGREENEETPKRRKDRDKVECPTSSFFN
jgi:hypothetical protein